MSILSRFSNARSSITVGEVNFGSGGIHLYWPNEIDAGQEGYAVAPDGSSLSSGEDGAWDAVWIVIGHDTASGDPLIMDTNDPALPVLRDFNGQGRWNPEQIAISLDAFLSSLREFAEIAKGRSTPVALEDNPVTPDEYNNFLARVSDLNKGQTSLDFWKALLEG